MVLTTSMLNIMLLCWCKIRLVCKAVPDMIMNMYIDKYVYIYTLTKLLNI